MIRHVLLALLLTTATALAQDPEVPVGGFPVAATKDSLATWSDGYRTRLDAYYPDPSKVAPPATGWPGSPSSVGTARLC